MRVRNVWALQLAQVSLCLLFEPLQCVLLSLAIYQRQEDAKDSQQTVGPVFLNCCSASCNPTHPLVNAEFSKIIRPERSDGDLGNVVNFLLQRYLATQQLAIR